MGIFCASMGSRNSQILFLFVFVAFNAFLYFLSVPAYEKGEMLSPTYKYAADGQRYWGAAVNLAERGEFIIRTAGPKLYYSFQEKKPPIQDLPLAKAASISRQARTVREEPLTRAGPLPALVFSIPMKLVGFERAAVVIVSLQCALLFATGLLARSLAGPFRCNGNLVQGLLIFNPNLISLAHHAQSEIIFVFLFTSILWFCSRLLTSTDSARSLEVILFGSCIGLLPLARPLGVYLILCIPIMLFLSYCIQRQCFRFRYLNLKQLVVVSLIAVSIMAPWVARNYVVTGKVTLTHSEGIMMQWHYKSLTRYLGEKDLWAELTHKERSEIVQRSESCEGARGPKCRQAAVLIYLRAIVDRPVSDLAYALFASWGKLLFSGGVTQIASYIGVDRPDAHNFLYDKVNLYTEFSNLMKKFLKEYKVFLALFLISFAFVTIVRALGIVGLTVVRGSQLWALTFFYAQIVAVFLMMYLFSGISRFRAPLEPILMLYATVGMSYLTGIVRHRRLKSSTDSD